MMRVSCVLFLSLMFHLLTSCAWGDELTVRSVDFYPMGARFTFEVPADGKFEFTLPGAFEESSVRACGQMEVSSLRVERLTRAGWVPPSLAKLREQIEAKKRELDIQTMRKSTLESTLKRLQDPFPKDFGGKDMLYFIQESEKMSPRLETDLVDAGIAVTKTAQDLTNLEAELSGRMPDRPEEFLKISGSAAKPVLMEAFTNSAVWEVRYDMALDSASGRIEAKMYARARQKTGINVAGDFMFHTRRPSFGIHAPEVAAMVVKLRPKESSSGRAMMSIQADTAAAPMMAAKNVMDSAALPEPEVMSTIANASVKGSGSVDGDGRPEDIALGVMTIESTPQLVCIPDQEREAWIVASLDKVPPSLLAGTAELTVDGAATGRTLVPEYGMGQSLMPFGMAARVTSKKEPLISKKGSSWMGGSGIIDDGYVISVTNGMDTEREITVRDCLPFPADEKITLEVKKIEPQESERDKQNRLSWKLTLKPGETKELRVEYSLKYPSGDTLMFNSRRIRNNDSFSSIGGMR